MLSLSDQIKATIPSLKQLMLVIDKERRALMDKNEFVPAWPRAEKSKVDELYDGLDKIATLYNELIRWIAWGYG